MSIVNITEVLPLENPGPFTSSIKFKITFDSSRDLPSGTFIAHV